MAVGSVRSGVRGVLRLAWVGLIVSGTALAGDGGKSEPQRYVLTISGGVSLGAYEGGFFYYLMHHLRQRTPRGEMVVVTGASAGSLNSLMSILSTYGFKDQTPQESLFYRVWHSVGIEGLAQPEDVTPISLFSRNAFAPAIAMIREAWMAGIAADCDVYLGVTLTRRTPYQHQVRPGLMVIRQNEQLVLRIKGQGAGKPPLLSNAPIGDAADLPLALPFTGEAEHDFALLISALQASGAFPLAFEPQRLDICPGSLETPCTAQNALTSEFIDGGIFDNTPLGLADRIARHLYTNDAAYKKLMFGIVSAGDETHPDAVKSSSTSDAPQAQQGLFAYVNELARNLVNSARGRDISILLHEQPAMRERLLVNPRILPPAGSYFYAFSGFIDEGFRTFDFALGMMEADDFVRQGAHAQIAALSSNAVHHGASLPAWAGTASGQPWAIYRCLATVMADGRTAAEACPAFAPEAARFYPLIDTSLDLVRFRCLQNPATAADFPSCHMLEGRSVAIAPEPGETDRDYFFRALFLRSYVYDNSGNIGGKLWLRTQMQPVMRRWAELQPPGERAFIASGTHVTLDALTYAPPREITYLLVGTAITAGKSYSLATGPLSRLSMERGELGLMVQGLASYLGRAPDRLAFTPYAGLAVDLTPFVGTSLRPRAGLRLGYQASASDRWGRSKCDEERQKQLSFACSQGTLHPYISLSVLDRLRFDVVYQLFPFNKPYREGEISLMVGLQELSY